MDKTRCAWGNSYPIMTAYHDTEWGVPVWDDRAFFERMCLEGAQAGLSWLTILQKRENYRQAFDEFDPVKVASYGEDKVSELLANPGIVRNRAKIQAAIHNAQRVLDLMEEMESLSTFLWGFVGARTIQNEWRTLSEVPAQTEISRRMSKELTRRGFKFVGPTICYAMMQACGLVNDHTTDCFRHSEIKGMAR